MLRDQKSNLERDLLSLHDKYKSLVIKYESACATIKALEKQMNMEMNALKVEAIQKLLEKQQCVEACEKQIQIMEEAMKTR